MHAAASRQSFLKNNPERDLRTRATYNFALFTFSPSLIAICLFIHTHTHTHSLIFLPSYSFSLTSIYVGTYIAIPIT